VKDTGAKLSCALIMIGIVLAFFPISEIYRYKKSEAVSDRSNAQAVEIARQTETAPASVKETVFGSDESRIAPEDDIDIAALKDVNPDTVGLLRLQGEEFPVVQAEDNTKYLTTGWNGEKTGCGAIFMDESCDGSSKNTILYGHHMKSGKMFGNLGKYLSDEYAEEHPSFKWISAASVDTYEVTAVICTSAADIKRYMDMDLKSDIDRLSEKAEETGKLYKDMGADDTYMSLITCEYEHEDGRLIVIGRRAEHLERN
jgi:sortase B